MTRGREIAGQKYSVNRDYSTFSRIFISVIFSAPPFYAISDDDKNLTYTQSILAEAEPNKKLAILL